MYETETVQQAQSCKTFLNLLSGKEFSAAAWSIVTIIMAKWMRFLTKRVRFCFACTKVSVCNYDFYPGLFSATMNIHHCCTMLIIIHRTAIFMQSLSSRQICRDCHFAHVFSLAIKIQYITRSKTKIRNKKCTS